MARLQLLYDSRAFTISLSSLDRAITAPSFTVEHMNAMLDRLEFNREHASRHIGMSDRRWVITGVVIAVVFLISLVCARIASATPSSTFWAPSVATCQAKYVPHVTYDTYYGRGTPPPLAGVVTSTGVPAYPVDTGLTMGILPWNKVQSEVGYDLLFPSTNPIFFFLNGKLCTPESSLFKGSPAIGGGIYNVGFRNNVTNANILYVMAQKTPPIGGYVAGGIYHGTNDVLFTNSDGEIVKTGAMFSATSPDINVGVKGLKKIVVLGDVQTGKNVFGAGGVGVEVYFNDYINLIVGPVFFIDKALQPGGARTMWTTQLDIDIPLGR